MGALGLDRIGQISIPVKDVPRAVRFYRDTLGMKLLFEFPGMGFFDCAGVRLMLSMAEKPEHDHPASVLYYKVDDIRGAVAELKERGAEFLDEPHLIAKLPDHELWMTFLHDTEGNTLALMSEVR